MGPRGLAGVLSGLLAPLALACPAAAVITVDADSRVIVVTGTDWVDQLEVRTRAAQAAGSKAGPGKVWAFASRRGGFTLAGAAAQSCALPTRKRLPAHMLCSFRTQKQIVINTGDGNDSIKAAFIASSRLYRSRRISISSGGGDDRIRIRDTGPLRYGAYVRANDGADTIVTGTPGPDRILGGRGGDRIDGGGGDDTIEGDPGRDILIGGRGNDHIVGGTGADALYGDAPTFSGGRTAGRDLLQGSTGNDRIYGGPGRDRLDGGTANDRLFGGAGNDRLGGGDNNDTLDGQAGTNLLHGNNGADTLLSRLGRDRLFGGLMGDLIVDRGGPGDELDGGPGDDRLVSHDGRSDELRCGTGINSAGPGSSDRLAADCVRMPSGR